MPIRPKPSRDDQVRAVLPLTPVGLHILLALVDADRHGLGIASHVEEFSGGRLTLGPGTLYGAMKRLLELNLVDDEQAGPGEGAEDSRRRYYRITPLGRRALEVEARHLASFLDVARLKRVLR